jgi:hypothetical protein
MRRRRTIFRWGSVGVPPASPPPPPRPYHCRRCSRACSCFSRSRRCVCACVRVCVIMRVCACACVSRPVYPSGGQRVALHGTPDSPLPDPTTQSPEGKYIALRARLYNPARPAPAPAPAPPVLSPVFPVTPAEHAGPSPVRVDPTALRAQGCVEKASEGAPAPPSEVGLSRSPAGTQPLSGPAPTPDCGIARENAAASLGHGLNLAVRAPSVAAAAAAGLPASGGVELRDIAGAGADSASCGSAGRDEGWATVEKTRPPVRVESYTLFEGLRDWIQLHISVHFR